MKFKSYITGLLLFITVQAFSQNTIFVADKVKASFFSEARMENIQATSLTGSSAAINANT